MSTREEKKAIRIIFVSHASRLEGAEMSMLQIIEHLAQEKKIVPLVILPKSGPLENILINKNIQYIRAIRYPWWVEPTNIKKILLGPLKYFWNILSWYFIKSSVKSFNPDIVYINTLVSPFGSIIAKDLNIPKIWHAHEFIPQGLEKDYAFGRDWSLAKVAESTAIIANSHAVMDDIAHYIPKYKQHIIYNGTNLVDFNFDKVKEKIIKTDYLSTHQINLVMIGYISKNKGQVTAIKALAELRNKGINATLTLVGEVKKHQGYDIKLNQLISDLKIKDQINMVGWKKNVADFYEEANITLVCSRGEGFGKTIIESMALGTPVICSNTGGAKEIIEKVDSRLLFKEGDYKSLESAIVHLMQDDSWYEIISKKGRQVVEENFDEELYVNKIYQVICDVYDSKQKILHS